MFFILLETKCNAKNSFYSFVSRQNYDVLSDFEEGIVYCFYCVAYCWEAIDSNYQVVK